MKGKENVESEYRLAMVWVKFVKWGGGSETLVMKRKSLKMNGVYGGKCIGD